VAWRPVCLPAKEWEKRRFSVSYEWRQAPSHHTTRLRCSPPAFHERQCLARVGQRSASEHPAARVPRKGKNRNQQSPALNERKKGSAGVGQRSTSERTTAPVVSTRRTRARLEVGACQSVIIPSPLWCEASHVNLLAPQSLVDASDASHAWQPIKECFFFLFCLFSWHTLPYKWPTFPLSLRGRSRFSVSFPAATSLLFVIFSVAGFIEYRPASPKAPRPVLGQRSPHVRCGRCR
jgi:hypothetical protein